MLRRASESVTLGCSSLQRRPLSRASSVAMRTRLPCCGHSEFSEYIERRLQCRSGQYFYPESSDVPSHILSLSTLSSPACFSILTRRWLLGSLSCPHNAGLCPNLSSRSNSLGSRVYLDWRSGRGLKYVTPLRSGMTGRLDFDESWCGRSTAARASHFVFG